jgi:hypothetical protein
MLCNVKTCLNAKRMSKDEATMKVKDVMVQHHTIEVMRQGTGTQQYHI